MHETDAPSIGKDLRRNAMRKLKTGQSSDEGSSEREKMQKRLCEMKKSTACLRTPTADLFCDAWGLRLVCKTLNAGETLNAERFILRHTSTFGLLSPAALMH